MQVSAITPEIFWVGQKVHSGFLYNLTEKPKQTFWATQYFTLFQAWDRNLCYVGSLQKYADIIIALI